MEIGDQLQLVLMYRMTGRVQLLALTRECSPAGPTLRACKCMPQLQGPPPITPHPAVVHSVQWCSCSCKAQTEQMLSHPSRDDNTFSNQSCMQASSVKHTSISTPRIVGVLSISLGALFVGSTQQFAMRHTWHRLHLALDMVAAVVLTPYLAAQ